MRKFSLRKKKMHEVQHDRLEWENYLHKKMPSLFPSVNILTQISAIIQRGSRSRAVQVYTLTSQKYSNCALVGTHFPVFKESLAFVSATINFSRVFFILEGKKNTFVTIAFQEFGQVPNYLRHLVNIYFFNSLISFRKCECMLHDKEDLETAGGLLFFFSLFASLKLIRSQSPSFPFDLMHSAKQ